MTEGWLETVTVMKTSLTKQNTDQDMAFSSIRETKGFEIQTPHPPGPPTSARNILTTSHPTSLVKMWWTQNFAASC